MKIILTNGKTAIDLEDAEICLINLALKDLHKNCYQTGCHSSCIDIDNIKSKIRRLQEEVRDLELFDSYNYDPEEAKKEYMEQDEPNNQRC